MQYETIFNTNYFIIDSKITYLHSFNCSAVLAYIYIHTQVAVYWRVKMTDTHPYAPLISHTPTQIHLWQASCQHFQDHFITYTDKQLSTRDLIDDDRHIPIPTPDGLYKHTFFLHTYRSVSLSLTHHYMQPACILISPGLGESSQQRQSYCRLYCETSGCGVHIFYFLTVILLLYFCFSGKCSASKCKNFLMNIATTCNLHFLFDIIVAQLLSSILFFS